MKSKQVNSNPRTYVLVFDKGDEVVQGLEDFCKAAALHAAGITAIGAFGNATLGFFEFASKDYKHIVVNEQAEVLSLIGDIVMFRSQPKLHAHVVVGKIDGTAHGGHLLSAVVNPTLEVVMTELPAHLHREMDGQYGIPLIRL